MTNQAGFSPLPEDLSAAAVLGSIGDGVYITDRNRRIVYWNDAAERITGWSCEQVVGRCCHEQVLCHVDKDGRKLCGEEHCPLHRSIRTGHHSDVPIVVYAMTPHGKRVPMSVSTSPLRDAAGNIIGGVEIFRDMRPQIEDMRRAQAIQESVLKTSLKPDRRLRVHTLYSPQETVGGDFIATEDIDEDHVALFLADVMGHGVGAALHSMYFRLLWVENRHLLSEPTRFLSLLDQKMHPLLREDFAFATAVAAVFDKETGRLVFSGAGHPSPLVIRAGGEIETPGGSSPPLGLTGESDYVETALVLSPGDSLFLYSDGAIEGRDSTGRDLGEEGLARIIGDVLRSKGSVSLKAIEERALAESCEIRPKDDVAMIWMSYQPAATS